MEASRWRKWLASPTPLEPPRGKKGGMLKLLLGHWKDHRRKPSLLPEDVDLPTNEASRINPIFEDSEGSVTSSHHPHSEIDPSSTEENNTPTELTSGDVNLDLVDISTPPRLKSESEEAINHINRVLEDALDGESLRSSDHLKSENEAKNEDSSPSGEQEVKNEVPPAIAQLIKQASTVNQQQVEAKSVSEELVEPPPEPTAPEPKEEPVPEPLNKTEKVQREELTKMVPGTSVKTQQSAEPVPASSSAETTKVKDLAPPVDSSKETEIKSANLKTRAIDELIKKFQGQKSDDTPGLQTVSSFLHSPNRKDVGKVRSPLFKNEIKKTEAESEPKKESLSTIFKFPPPPPLETKDPKNNLKVTKTENSHPIPKAEESSAEKTQGTTRSDSSLSRNITVSSKDTEVFSKPIKEINPDSKTNAITRSNDSPKLKASKPEDPKPVKETKSNSTTNSLTKSSSSILKASNTTTILPSTESTPKKETSPSKVADQPPLKSATEKTTTVTQVDSKPDQASNQSTSSTESISASLIKKDTKPQSSAPIKQKIEKQTKFFQKNNSDTLPSTSKHQDTFNNTTLKTSSTLQTQESNPEGNGVTRGDQVSDESSADPLKSADPLPKPSPPKSKHPTKEKKSVHHRACKHCKRSKEDISTSFKRGQCEDYYDVITGKRLKSPNSESFGSELSWEEKELIRKLRRSKRSPSVKSRHSRPRDSGRFRRHHPLRRSMSEDSTVNGSVCSCDQCWLFLVKDYAYGRASLRAMPPNQLMCTCRPVRPEFLGRKVQFRSDTIHEGSQSGATSATPTIPEENPSSKKGEESGEPPTSDSNLSSVSKADAKDKANGKDHKRSKHLNENYRLVTPWELEEWDLAMRKHLLMKRRKRARYMVFMALAMVVFIGLIVTILMIYLRRKSL